MGYPVEPQIFNPRVRDIMSNLKLILSSGIKGHDIFLSNDKKFHELAQILDYYFSKTLAPTVIVSQNEDLIQDLCSIIASPPHDIHCIPNVNPDTYKMMKCLYDRSDTPNLRDDIISLGGGSGKDAEFVSVEFKCYSP